MSGETSCSGAEKLRAAAHRSRFTSSCKTGVIRCNRVRAARVCRFSRERRQLFLCPCLHAAGASKRPERKTLRKTAFAICVLLASGAAAAAGDDRFVDFAIRQAHERGFTECDRGIRDVLSSASGEDIRVFTDALKPIASDQLQLAAIWGKPGDTVLTDANLRMKAGRCHIQVSSTVVASTSCENWLNSQSAFSLRATTVGVLISRSPGGVDALLRKTGNDSCVITYRRGSSY